MCGINAIFAYRPEAPRVDLEEFLRTRDAMAARGPDGTGSWRAEDGRVALGHRRLAIIDPRPAGAQPMLLKGGDRAEGTLAITFNGEIYNYKALRAELAAAGCNLRTNSDTEVLLHLYRRHGPAMVERLRGMFAFVLWDEARRGVLLARDPFGIKPLYYADDGRTLRIASQVKALLAGGKIDTRPEPAGHVGFHLWGHVPDPFTFFRGVRALPAGATLWLDAAGDRAERRYFTVAEGLRSAAAGPVGLRDALLDSVRHHLVADVPVGLFLSAGLDSSTIAALAVEAAGPDLRSVTLGFDAFRGGPLDETPLAEAVARALGTRHETRWIGRAAFEQASAPLLAAMDQPTIDGVNVYFVARATAAAGLKVALSGLGGDELFAGYPSFQQIPGLVAGLAPMRMVPGLGRAFRIVAAPLLRRLTSPKYAGLFEYGGSYGSAYLLRRGLFMPWELPDLLDGELVREGWAALQPLACLAREIDGLVRPRQKIAALEMAVYMESRLLRDADWAGMAHSLEIRTPLVDAMLLRRLAPALAGDNPPDKRAMATTPARALPPALLARPKSGFVAPVREWLAGEGSDDGERGLRGWARRVYRSCYGDLAGAAP